MTQKDEAAAAQAKMAAAQSIVIAGGIFHGATINAGDASVKSTVDASLQNVKLTWYAEKMSQHRWWYWTFHAALAFVVALAAAAVWEYWLIHLFRH